ncbi:uncharacterized protein KQ657_001061 [Scheffersomyces spartinae]|uniref:RecA family profile 1 domain-containing protein n=1 Tax=Scheffersomyces spartinae TaxID=45513 RepID=A0A9P8AH51_9ASCO|nr:uncharacterized protein KQ657_001061 [Scheffersomyces spartinae]KAG7192956.1 hypothetical protein KQ657_001061 [Scheffersomyces spartinae]
MDTGLDCLETEFPRLHELLVLHGLTCMDLLLMGNACQVARRVGRSALEVGEYLAKLRLLIQCSERKLDKNQIDLHVSTGLPSLDAQLGGGIIYGDVTEVVGASGSGKSQFLLNLALRIQPCIVITTEAPLETRRMSDMIPKTEAKEPILNNVSYIYCPDLEYQDHILYTQLPIKLLEGGIKCVIIDSISHHLRRDDAITPSDYLIRQLLEQQKQLNCEGLKHFEHEHDQMRNLFFKSDAKYTDRQSKQQYVHGLYSYLLRLAREYHIAIVVANQVSDYSTPFEDCVTSNALDLDCQIGLYSGWDNSTAYNSCHPESLLQVNFNRSLDLQEALMGSIFENLDEPPSKRSKVDEMQSSLHRLSTSEQMQMLDELHSYTGMVTKKQVPTLGYPWSRFVRNRILLIKTYKPIYKDDVAISQSDNSSRLNTQRKPLRSLDSIIGGWQIERYCRVASSPFVTCNTSNYSKIPFLIETAGISEVKKS